MVADTDDNDFCASCRLNHLIPALSTSYNRVLWMRIERAKRRLLFGLLTLRLPVFGRDTDPVHGLAFDFLADPSADTEFADDTGTQQVLTGHRAGTITINIAEADPSARERMRERMGEQYRTLLGHFRHEIAHWYWDRLIRAGRWESALRDLRGAEQADYAEALHRYYANGPREDWQEHGVSPYASSHPWEDWAETWAHYLHMVDTLETAHDHGFVLQGRVVQPPRVAQRAQGPSGSVSGFDDLQADWVQLTLALNALNRSMGLRDAYPFALGPKAIEKLRFVHQVIEAAAGQH